ncbi:hypothetical protein [Streptomyces spinoverrucosus]|uniref:hypothetical protein n=1 Tax=Streptomyces spinoverrucosus TaxID=284043 RepID=UPI0011419C87|nr:hypothetical protein [Streptomyces spinoverrucosus]
MTLHTGSFVLPVIGRGHEDPQGLFVDPLQLQDLAPILVFDERSSLTGLEMQEQQFPFEEVAAVVSAGAHCQQWERGVEGHRMNREARVNEEAAAQIRRSIDRYWGRDAIYAPARHGQQITPLVPHSQDGFVHRREWMRVGCGHTHDLRRPGGSWEASCCGDVDENQEQDADSTFGRDARPT